MAAACGLADSGMVLELDFGFSSLALNFLIKLMDCTLDFVWDLEVCLCKPAYDNERSFLCLLKEPAQESRGKVELLPLHKAKTKMASFI